MRKIETAFQFCARGNEIGRFKTTLCAKPGGIKIGLERNNMRIWLSCTEGTVELVEAKGGSEQLLKSIISQKQTAEVYLGPTTGRIYWTTKKGGGGHTDEVYFKVLKSI